MTLDPVSLAIAALAAGALARAWRGAVAGETQARAMERKRAYTIFLAVLGRVVFGILPFVALIALIGLAIAPALTRTGIDWQAELPRAIGPMITGTVIVVGWLATNTAVQFRDELARERQLRDTMIALRSEISAFVKKLDRFDIIQDEVDIAARLERGEVGADGMRKEYYPFATLDSDPVVFSTVGEALAGLPEETLDGVVRFYAEYTDLKALIIDLRADAATNLSWQRRRTLYGFLVTRRITALQIGLFSIVSINQQLGQANPTRIPRSGKNPDITHRLERIDKDAILRRRAEDKREAR